MNIIVCIKRVPDTETRVKIGADGKSLDPSGVQYVMAPYDEIAVEKALQLKEAAGAGTVTVLTLGPAEATKELRTALAMGADTAVHLTTSEAADARATATALAGAVKEREAYDLILLGKQATDEDDAAVGPMLASMLEIPCVTVIDSLEVLDGQAKVTREVEGESEVLCVDLPCVLTAQKSLAEPRYPGLKGIMAAKKKPLESKDAATEPSGTTIRSMSLPPPRSEVTMVEPTPDGVKGMFEALRNEKKVL